MEICKICENATATRVIHGVPLCEGCYVEGEYDLPETHIKLIEMSGSPMPPKPPPEVANDLVCSVCGKECKSAFGLKSHMRVHK